nr:phosphomethylpyrimidine synthase [Verrucomicrobiota bacterium]
MIAFEELIQPRTIDALPTSRRVYVPGQLNPSVRVPFREVGLSSTKASDGRTEINEPVRVYDCSGPWGDPTQAPDSSQGLAPVRAPWIRSRGDVGEYEGREVRPEDNGYLTRGHEEYASQAERRNRLDPWRGPRRRPLRASAGHPVTQLWYARQGVITPEMEFIAIRENMGSARAPRAGSGASPDPSDQQRSSLSHQHPGEPFGASIPREITPEFVRSE